jgi:hypothetical protein
VQGSLGGAGAEGSDARVPVADGDAEVAATPSPQGSPRAAPPPIPRTVRGGQGRHRQGSGCGGGAGGRVGAGVLLSCIFSRLQRRNFSAGSGAGAAAPQQLPRLRVGEESRERPRQVPWARIRAWRLLFPFSPLPYYLAGLECSPGETPPPSFPLGPATGFWNSW